MQLSLTIGDYYQDSHRFTEKKDITVHTSHTWDEVASNYQKNVEQFGFSPVTAFEENQTFAVEAIKKLSEVGLKFEFYGTDYSENIRRSAADNKLIFCSDVSNFYPGTGTRYELDSPVEVTRIVMFFMGYGLDDFTWGADTSTIDVNKALNLQDLGLSFWVDED
jgi:hypothetical protein